MGWNLPALLALHVAADRFGWWDFDARGGVLLGMPVDLYLAWACLWGIVAALAFPWLPLAIVVALALAVDLVLMPAAAPVLVLGPNWLVGEAVALLIVVCAFIQLLIDACGGEPRRRVAVADRSAYS